MVTLGFGYTRLLCNYDQNSLAYEEQNIILPAAVFLIILKHCFSVFFSIVSCYGFRKL